MNVASGMLVQSDRPPNALSPGEGWASEVSRRSLREGRLSDGCEPPSSSLVGWQEGRVERESVAAGGPQNLLAASEVTVRQKHVSWAAPFRAGDDQ